MAEQIGAGATSGSSSLCTQLRAFEVAFRIWDSGGSTFTGLTALLLWNLYKYCRNMWVVTINIIEASEL